MAEPTRREQRRYPRHELYSAALIVIGGDAHLSEVKDISGGGARLGLPGSWTGGGADGYRLYFIFDQDTVLGLDARLAREGTDDLGFEYLDGQEAQVERILYESKFAEGFGS